MSADLLAEWRFEPGAAAALAAGAGLYLLAARRAGGWPLARTAAFLAAIAVLAASALSGVEARAGELLSAHMVQHLLMALVAAPLVAASAPVTLALRTLPRGGRRSLARLLHGRVLGLLTRPFVAVAVFGLVIVATHLSGFYALAVERPALHALEHMLYLGSALLFWAPLVGADPLPHRPSPAATILCLLLAMPPMALVGATLATAEEVRYAPYAERAGALEDQRLGATIMWVGGKLLLVAATLGVGWRALGREERRQEARERYAVPAEGGP